MSPAKAVYLVDPASRLRPRLRTEGECIVWIGAVDNHGYGNLDVNGRRMKAHRFAWELTHGPIPASMHVLHRCDNPPCCNVQHLFLGTHADNMRDMARKGRQWLQREPERALRGEAAPHSQLTEEQVRLVLASNESSPALAAWMNVPVAMINRVRGGRTWRHIEGPRIPGVERRRRRAARRRAEVEALLIAGHTRREIATALAIPMGTVHADCVKIRDANGLA